MSICWLVGRLVIIFYIFFLYKGLATLLLEVCPHAIYVHCASHCLNLAIEGACQVEQIALLNIKLSKIIDFFTSGPKRAVLLKILGTTLIKFSTTRWSQRGLAWERFISSYENIVKALKIILGLELYEGYEAEFDINTKTRARYLLKTLESSSFLVGK